MADSSEQTAPPASAPTERSFEEDFPRFSGKWFATLSPYPLECIMPEGEHEITGRLRTRLQSVRLFWLWGLLCLYTLVLSQATLDRQVSAGVRAEIVDEFFPDGGKASERLKEGEVTAGAKEILHADDVAQTLTWMTTFCRLKGMADDHIMESWKCRLIDLDLGESAPGRWDASTNRALPDDASDSTKRLKSRGVFEESVTEEMKETASKRKQALDKMCSVQFLNDHMVIGDDPVDEAHGGTGESPSHFHDPAEFTDRFLKKIDPSMTISGDFEELGGDPAIGLDQLHDEVEEIREQLQEIQEHQHEKAPGVHHSSFAQDLTSQTASKKHRSRLAQRMMHPDDEGDPPYSPGCFDVSSYGGIFREIWEETDVDSDGMIRLGKQEGKQLAKLLNRNRDREDMLDLMRKYDANNDAAVGLDEYAQMVKDNIGNITVEGRGYLTTKCRNHHFGLLSLCKPSHIHASYVTQNVHRGVGPQGFDIEKSNIYLDLTFEAVGEMRDSGWYRMSFEVTTEHSLGQRSLCNLITLCSALFMFLLLFIADFLLTIIRWPVSVFQLWRLRIESGLSFEEAKTRVMYCLDGFLDFRTSRSRFLSSTQLLMEFVFSFCFVGAAIIATFEALEPRYSPSGRLSPTCNQAVLNSDLDWMVKSLSSMPAKKGLSGPEYLLKCKTDLDQVSLAADFINMIVFETDASVHGWAIALLFVRCFSIFSLLDSFKWLPSTLELARPRICTFFAAYILLVFAFSTVLYIQFGDLYVQFSTLHLSFIALLLFSFGATDRAMDGMHPFIESTGTGVALYLLVFTVLIVTICLNVFTTIVIDAYTVASDPVEVEKVIQKRHDETSLSLIRLFAENPEDWSEERLPAAAAKCLSTVPV